MKAGLEWKVGITISSTILGYHILEMATGFQVFCILLNSNCYESLVKGPMPESQTCSNMGLLWAEMCRPIPLRREYAEAVLLGRARRCICVVGASAKDMTCIQGRCS